MWPVQIDLFYPLICRVIIGDSLYVVIFVKRHIYTPSCHGFHWRFLCAISCFYEFNISICQKCGVLAPIEFPLRADPAARASAAHFFFLLFSMS